MDLAQTKFNDSTRRIWKNWLGMSLKLTSGRLLLCCAWSGVLLYWIHAALTFWIMPPFISPIDTALWMLASLARWVSFAAIPIWALPRLSQLLHCNLRRSMLAFAAHLIPIMFFAYGSHVFRSDFAAAFNSDVDRYYPVGHPGERRTVGAPDEEEFLRAWKSGLFFISEFLIVALPLGIIMIWSFICRRRRILQAVFLCILLEIITFYCANRLKIWVMDYDFFFGSTALGPALMDIFFFFAPASDPATEFGLPILALFLTMTYLLDRAWSKSDQTDEDPEHGETTPTLENCEL